MESTSSVEDEGGPDSEEGGGDNNEEEFKWYAITMTRGGNRGKTE